MDFSKIKNKLLICLCCAVLILPFYLITFTYAIVEGESVNFSIIENYVLSGSQTISYNENFRLFYLELENGYTYYIDIELPEDSRTGFSNSLEAGSNVFNYTSYSEDTTFSTVIDGSTSDYMFFDLASKYGTTPVYTILKVPSDAYTFAVSDLVDNVGISQLWNIFDISINYIVVVVLFAFGCFIIFRIIRKISRGKEGL